MSLSKNSLNIIERDGFDDLADRSNRLSLPSLYAAARAVHHFNLLCKNVVVSIGDVNINFGSGLSEGDLDIELDGVLFIIVGCKK